VEIVAAAPTVKAGEHAREDPQGAAILNRAAADRLGLNVLADRIEDNPHNRTRFLVVGFNEPAKTGRDKTTLMFNLRNQPGELYRALGALQSEGVNLLMIESRPAQRAQFEYLFFLDCVGHRSDPNMARAIDALREQAMETVILGSYPAAE
jgi:chorismate mutase / prephenate dehydratase